MLFSESAGRVENAAPDATLFVITTKDHEPVGFSVAYSINARDRWLYLDVVVSAPAPHVAKMEAWLLTADFVFAWYPIHTIYREVPEFAAEELPLARSMGFEEQGTLESRLWLRDRLCAVQVLALSRDQWRARRPVFIDNINIQAAYDSFQEEGGDGTGEGAPPGGEP